MSSKVKFKRSGLRRLVVYLFVMVWLMIDLVWVQGPIYRLLQGERDTQSFEEPVTTLLARVYREPIVEEQLELAMQVHAWRRGQDLSGLQGEALAQLRRIVLMELVDDAILRAKVRFAFGKGEVDEAVLEREWDQFKSRFGNDAALAEACEQHGVSVEEMRGQLAARIQQEVYLRQRADKVVDIGEEQVRQFYDLQREQFKEPMRRHVRHLFAAHLDHPHGGAERLVRQWAQKLQTGEWDWQQAALRSEDLRTRGKGGDLGWIGAERLTASFVEPVFAMSEGEAKLISSELGAHWVEVLEVRPQRILGFPEVREEIRSALEDKARLEGIDRIRAALREEARASRELEFFVDWPRDENQ